MRKLISGIKELLPNATISPKSDSRSLKETESLGFLNELGQTQLRKIPIKIPKYQKYIYRIGLSGPGFQRALSELETILLEDDMNLEINDYGFEFDGDELTKTYEQQMKHARFEFLRLAINRKPRES